MLEKKRNHLNCKRLGRGVQDTHGDGGPWNACVGPGVAVAVIALLVVMDLSALTQLGLR